MNRLADIHLELMLEKRGLSYETEREILTKISAAARARDAKESRIRRMAVRLGELVAEVGCQLQSRYAPDPAATAR